MQKLQANDASDSSPLVLAYWETVGVMSLYSEAKVRMSCHNLVNKDALDIMNTAKLECSNFQTRLTNQTTSTWNIFGRRGQRPGDLYFVLPEIDRRLLLRKRGS